MGSFARPPALPELRFEIAPGALRLVPLLLGTASLVPQLGYPIPPALWAFRAPLDPKAGRPRWTLAGELSVTA